jgi:hypothetical protein
MGSNGESPAGIRPNRGLLVGGGVLVGVGGLLALSGALLVGTALVSASRRWMRALEQPPSEIAKIKLRQARAATSAGAKAWQSEP